MNILIFSQYFWPEKFLINDLADELSKKDKVIAITGYPNYPKGKLFNGYRYLTNKKDNYNKINIYRSLLITRKKGTKIDLIFNYLSFAFFSFFKILFLRKKKLYDICIVYAPSPLISLISIFLLKKFFNFKLYLWLQDLWPLVIKNKTKNKILKNIIFLICKYIYIKSDFILIQSNDYKKYLINNFGINENKIKFFPNWSQNQNKIKYTPSNDNIIRIAYTGNIGYAQNFSILVDLCKKNVLSNYEFHLFGDGRYKKELIDEINRNNINNIYLFPTMSFDLLINELQKFDALYLSLSDEYSHTIPAKFQFYISLGMPILANLNGYLNKLIKDEKIGLVSSANNLSSIEKMLKDFLKLSKDQKSIIANNAYKLYENNFSKKQSINKIYKIINEKNYY